MDLRDIILGLFWLVMANIGLYFLYPLYGSMLDGFATSVVGEFGLTDTMVAIGWGGYLLAWMFAGIGMPIYLIIQGASRD